MLYTHERKVRLQQYEHAIERRKEIGVITEFNPLAIVVLRAHAHDAPRPHQDSGQRSLLCFAPLAIRTYSSCAIRVSPSCLFTAHLIQSTETSDQWICLLSYHEHVGLAIPIEHDAVTELVRSPQSAAQPAGWHALMELGP